MQLHYDKCHLHKWSPVQNAELCTLNTLVAESQTNSVSTSAPWKVTINNAYFICVCIFLPPGRTFEPSGPQLYQRHVFVCDSNNSNELVIRRHQKGKEEIELIFAQPFYRVE